MSDEATNRQKRFLKQLLKDHGLSMDTPAQQRVIRQGKTAVSRRITELLKQDVVPGPSEGQMDLLAGLGYHGAKPALKAAASVLIDELKKQQGVDNLTEK